VGLVLQLRSVFQRIRRSHDRHGWPQTSIGITYEWEDETRGLGAPKDLARQALPPQFAKLVTKTSMPFVQAITDLPPLEDGTPVGRLLNGKATLVGDALSGF
jgi:hypothetical protein